MKGASIHEHFHPQEEVYEAIEGELEVRIEGSSQVARPGIVAIAPGAAQHSVKVRTDRSAIIVDFPLCQELRWAPFFAGGGSGAAVRIVAPRV